MLILSLPLSFRLLVHNSFKNLAYLGSCFIASNRGMFTSTFLNVSKISFSISSIFLLEIALGGNGRGICYFSFSLYCYLDIEYKIEMKKQFFSSLDLLENEVSVIILIYIHFFYEKPFSGMICSIFLLLCLRLQVLL